MEELRKYLESLGISFEEFKAQIEKRFKMLEASVGEVETAYGRLNFPASSGKIAPELGSAGKFAVDIGGRKIPVLAKGNRLTSLYPAPGEGSSTWSVGDFVRASLGLTVHGSVLERGTATVPDYVSANIIDAVREKARIMQAGSITIPIEGKTTLCRITSDPTVVQHAEGVGDITESVPVFAPVALDPGTLAALLPLSVEIVQDSPNLDAALQTSIAGAIATKLDQLCVAKILADSAIPDSATGQATDTWEGVLAAVGSMLALDQDLPKACICGAGDYVSRASQKASTAGTWLGAPPALTSMLDLETGGVTDGTAILGDFERGFGVAVRQELRLEVIRWGKPTYGSHLLAAYARIAGYVLQPNCLYIQKKTV